jgi:hypothetical protein
MRGKYRSAYAKFRAGVAPLRIETGRYERFEVNERLCFNCSKLGINVNIQEPFLKELRETKNINI